MKVAVCICTCRRPMLLDRLLTTLAGLEVGDFADEIGFIQVVDNAPNGEARAVCDRHRASLPVALHFAEERRQGISFARNRAVTEALDLGADFVAFIDDDDIPNVDWLLRLLEVQRSADAQIVFGYWQAEDLSHVPEWLREIKFFVPPPVDGVDRFGLPQWASTSNVLLRRDVLETMMTADGVFRPEFALVGGGDMDFFIRATRQGASFTTASASIVKVCWDRERTTLRGILRRAFRLGMSQVYLDRHHGAAREFAKQRWQRLLATPKLLFVFFRLPFIGGDRRRKAFASQAFALFRRMGQLSAYFGKRFAYYR